MLPDTIDSPELCTSPRYALDRLRHLLPGQLVSPGAVLGTLAFGLADSISIYIQAIGTSGNFPRELVIALPYILTIVLTIFRKNFNVPAKLGIPYSKEN